MMGRLLGRHPNIFTFHELHFFEELWSPRDQTRILLKKEARLACARLINVERNGYLQKQNSEVYRQEADVILEGAALGNLYLTEVFERYLRYETKRNGKSFSCDHTPRNVFYIGEILRAYPEARIINMVRDPRDVVLSQKNKWRRRFLGGSNIPLRESFRSWVNYHPITISRLWKAAVGFADKFGFEKRLLTVYFEDLLSDPEEKIAEICKFICLPYMPDMLRISQIGSSHGQDRPDAKGINPNMANSWRKRKGLREEEIHWCQQVTGSMMLKHGYEMQNVVARLDFLLLSLITLPIKLGLAFVLNIGRMRNITSAVRKRFLA